MQTGLIALGLCIGFAGACGGEDEVAAPPAPAPAPAQRSPAPASAQVASQSPSPLPPHDTRANPGSSEDPGGTRVTASTPLAPGDAVHVEWNEKWYAGEVVSLLPDGSVRVHYVGWAPSWDAVATRARLRIPDADE